MKTTTIEEAMTNGLWSILNARDPLTAAHSMRVREYSLLVGKALSITEDEYEILSHAALLHDYGKMGIPEVILWRTGTLSPEEDACMRLHTRLTNDLLSKFPFSSCLSQVPFVASCHHEKMDGSGYQGLKGDEIPFLSRIIAFCNEFDVSTALTMVPERHAHFRRPIVSVHKNLQSQRSSQFDADMVDAFYGLPCDQVLEVMKSGPGLRLHQDLEEFKGWTWKQMMELCSNNSASARDQLLKETFRTVYHSEVGSDYSEYHLIEE